MKTLQVNWKWMIALYVIVVIATSMSARANQLTWMPRSDVPNTLPKNLVRVSGQIQLDQDGVAFLVLENTYYELVDKEGEPLRLANLADKHVQVLGFQPRYNVGPVYHTFASSPLLDNRAVTSGSAVLVVHSFILLE